MNFFLIALSCFISRPKCFLLDSAGAGVEFWVWHTALVMALEPVVNRESLTFRGEITSSFSTSSWIPSKIWLPTLRLAPSLAAFFKLRTSLESATSEDSLSDLLLSMEFFLNWLLTVVFRNLSVDAYPEGALENCEVFYLNTVG